MYTKGKMLSIISIFIQLFILINFTNANEKYNNNYGGISFIIPEGVVKKGFIKNEFGINVVDTTKSKYYYDVSFKTFKELKKDKINEYRIEIKKEWELADFFEAVKNSNQILIEQPYTQSNGSHRKYFLKKDAIGESIFFFDFPCTGAFYSMTILYKDKIISIQIFYNDLSCSIAQQYPEYFIGDKREGYIAFGSKDRDNATAFYKLIESKDKRAPKELLKLQEYFNEIVKSLQFFEPTVNETKGVKLYTPTIENLRFRETPTLDGKFIRLLVKGEKLELLERGKTEEVSGTKGTWVKVKTEKGEVGWAFDAYLEEVKKN